MALDHRAHVESPLVPVIPAVECFPPEILSALELYFDAMLSDWHNEENAVLGAAPTIVASEARKSTIAHARNLMIATARRMVAQEIRRVMDSDEGLDAENAAGLVKWLTYVSYRTRIPIAESNFDIDKMARDSALRNVAGMVRDQIVEHLASEGELDKLST